MAAVLSNNMSDIKQVSFLWRNVSEWDLKGPDVNESHYKFTVNDNYAAVWDGSIKGVSRSSSDHCSK
jgi:DNA polymerase-3 subunit alpha